MAVVNREKEISERHGVLGQREHIYIKVPRHRRDERGDWPLVDVPEGEFEHSDREVYESRHVQGTECREAGPCSWPSPQARERRMDDRRRSPEAVATSRTRGRRPPGRQLSRRRRACRTRRTTERAQQAAWGLMGMGPRVDNRIRSGTNTR